MKKLLVVAVVFAGIGMSSCDKCECTARNANGEALYEVDNKSKCQEQLVNDGDYCECDC